MSVPCSPRPRAHLTYLGLGGFFVFVFDPSHSNRCEVRSHRGFDLRFLLSSDVAHLFTSLWVVCGSFWGKCLFRSSAHFLICFFAVGLCEFFIYFGYQPLVRGFAHFLPFLLLGVPFAMQQLFSWMQSLLFIFAFVAFAFGVNLKNHHQDQCQGAYCLFSSRSFLVSGLIFRSLTCR